VQDDVMGEQRLEPGEIALLGRGEEPPRQLLALLGRGLEARPALLHVPAGARRRTLSSLLPTIRATSS
jgi:hypothetical protein